MHPLALKYFAAPEALASIERRLGHEGFATVGKMYGSDEASGRHVICHLNETHRILIYIFAPCLIVEDNT